MPLRVRTAAWLPALLLIASCDPGSGATGRASESVVTIDDEAVIVEADAVRLPLAGNEDLLALDSSHVLASHVRTGFLRRVSSVERVGDEVVIATDSAEIGDAVIEMELSERLIDHGGVIAPSGDGAIGASRAPLEIAEFRTVFGPHRVHSGLGMDVDVDGHLQFDPALDFEMSVEDRQLRRLLLRAEGELNAGVHVHLDVRADNQELAYRHALWKWQRPFVQFVGPVPVVEVVEMELGVGVAAEVDGNLVVDIGGELSSAVAVGTLLEDGEWSDIGERRFDITDARATIAGTGRIAAIQLFVYAQVGVKLYDAAGPYVEIRPNFRLVEDEGWHMGSAGVYGEVGIEARVPIIGRSLGVWDRQLFDVALVFHESETSAALMSEPEPAPEVTGCEEVPPQGTCTAAVLRTCVDGMVVERDCAAEGLGCGFVHGVDQNECVEGCGDVDAAGACHGSSLRYCRADTLNIVECPGTCSRPDESSPAYCL